MRVRHVRFCVFDRNGRLTRLTGTDLYPMITGMPSGLDNQCAQQEQDKTNMFTCRHIPSTSVQFLTMILP